MTSFYLFDITEKISKDISFNSLIECVNFEDICKGRKAAILVDPLNETIPIIRTTTCYKNPAQKFTETQYKLITIIKNAIQTLLDENKNEHTHTIDFNNAMIEIYDNTYHKMGFHTDQSLDLKENSYICLFSCYETPPINPR